MIGIHNFHQPVKNHAVGAVQVHVNLLPDDALLPLHAFLGKIGSGHKFQQQPQRPVKFLSAGKIIGGHVVAGKGIDICPQRRKFAADIPSAGQLKHFMLQIVRNTAGDGVFCPIQGEACMDGAKAGDQVGNLFFKSPPGHHRNLQPVGQAVPIEHLVQLRVFIFCHWVPPSVRKKLLWSLTDCAIRTKSATSTRLTCCKYCAGVRFLPLRAAVA